LLKIFFFNLYTLTGNISFYLLITLSFFSFLLLFSNLRKKFAYFILVVISYSVWGFLLDLDGIMLVFLTAEFTIFFLLVMTYLQLYGNYTFVTQNLPKNIIIYFLLIILYVYEPQNTFHFYTSYYKALSHIVSSDFYILYYFLFEKLPLLVIVITLIISFFSLFFIVMYFSLKMVKLTAFKNVKNIHFLRKQTLLKQTTFSSKLYTFQN